MITDLTRRFSVDGFELAWDEWGSGDGTPLVLCHGFSGSSHDFALHIEDLADDRRVATIDHRGHGLSSNSGSVDDYTVEKIVADVIAWIDTEIGAPADLLGHSMGGRVAMRLAVERPDLLRSLVLMDTTAWRFGVEDDPMQEIMVAFFESVTPETVLPPFDSPEEALIQAATSAEWQAMKDERTAAFDPMGLKGFGLQLFADRLEEVGHRLAEITVPVTVIVGELDHVLVDHAPRLADSVADGELVVIAGAHHSPQLTHPDEWRAAVDQHLARAASSD